MIAERLRGPAVAWLIGLSVLAGCASPAVYQEGLLPEELTLCGRLWERDALGRRQSAAEIRSNLDGEPAVVERIDRCPAGACTDVAQAGACHTVIYVRVDRDAYLGYSLQGGP